MTEQEGFSFDKEIPSKKFADDPTPPHKLHRKEGPDTSKAAAYQVDTTKMEGIVYGAIETFQEGCCQDQVLDYLKNAGFEYGNVTPRFRALIEKGLIVDTGRRVKGKQGRMQRIIIASKYLKGNQ
jgi:hypothetical protein